MSSSLLQPPRPSLFVERLVCFLMPFFITLIPDMNEARDEILQTLATYGARTRAEMLNAAQIIAFGFSALDVLAEVNEIEMSPAMRLRFRGCANSLNRSCQQNENALAKRLAHDPQSQVAPGTDPLDDVPQPQVIELIQHAEAKIAVALDLKSAASNTHQPATVSKQKRNKRSWGSAMTNHLADIGVPVRRTDDRT